MERTKITETYDRARKCTYCNHKIKAGEPHIRFQHSTYRASLTINICGVCLLRAINEIPKKQLKEFKEKLFLEEI